jgi:DNA-binding MarR family transcriptional regulator
MSRRATPSADDVLAIADRLHSAAIHLLRRVRREDRATGLSPARLSALSVVVFGGPLRVSALARAEQVRTPTMTPMVDALARDGLVTREADPRDARATLVRATAKGARLMAEGRSRRVSVLAQDLRQLSAAERGAVVAAVTVLERLLDRQRQRDELPRRPRREHAG